MHAAAQKLDSQIKKPKLMLLLWSMHGGGAERIASYLAKYVDRNKFHVVVGLMRAYGPYLGDLKGVEVVSVDRGNSRFAVDHMGNEKIFHLKNLFRVLFAPWFLAKLIKSQKPDVVLSFCKGMSINTMAALWFTGRKNIKWLAREGNNTKAVIDHESPNKFVATLLLWLTRLCYRSCDRLISISEELGQRVKNDLQLQPHKIESIFNAVDIAHVSQMASQEVEIPTTRPFYIAVGRLDYQKGLDTLISAYKKSSALESSDLVILGKGPVEDELRALAVVLGVKNRVHFVGWQQNPWAWLARSKAFILSSRWEGFGNVVIEAMACGAPVMVSDCNFGPKEIIRYGTDGFLFPAENEEALSKVISQFEEQPEKHQEWKERSLRRAHDFAIDKIVPIYETALLRELSR